MVNSDESLGILIISAFYLLGGLLFMPSAIAAFWAYGHGTAGSYGLLQLCAMLLVLVVIPIVLAFTLWKGYKVGWLLGMAFAAFNIVLYALTFFSLHISLFEGPPIGNSVLGPVGYAIAYGIVYLSTYLVAGVEVILSVSLIIYLMKRGTREYFGLA